MGIIYKTLSPKKEDCAIEYTTEEDFEIYEPVQESITSMKRYIADHFDFDLDLENKFRGLSPKMQLVLWHRVILLFTQYRILTTGVKHVDDLLTEIKQSCPQWFLDSIKECVKDSKMSMNFKSNSDVYYN